MKEFNFKYYPAKILISILCSFIGIIVLSKSLINPNPDSLQIFMWIIGSIGLLGIIFFLINKFIMNKWFLKLFTLPNLNGNYEGELISSYHINDDMSKPNIKKFVKMEITHNLNGFYVKTHFYDSEFHKEESSISESISHDIEAKDNGEFLIIYRYRNLHNTFHKDHQKYTLNQHDGIAQLYYNPKTNTLKGKYFNDSQERPSYGTINLNKKH
jgi:hypothetical protein